MLLSLLIVVWLQHEVGHCLSHADDEHESVQNFSMSQRYMQRDGQTDEQTPASRS